MKLLSVPTFLYVSRKRGKPYRDPLKAAGVPRKERREAHRKIHIQGKADMMAVMEGMIR